MKLVIVSIFSKRQNPISKKFGESIIHHFQNASDVKETVVITNSKFPISLSENNLKIIPKASFQGFKNSYKVLKMIYKEKPDAIFFNVDFTDKSKKSGVSLFKFLIPSFFSLRKTPSILFLNNYLDKLELNRTTFSGDYFNNKVFKVKKYIIFKILPKFNLVTLPNFKDFKSFNKEYPKYPAKHSPYVRTERVSQPNFLNADRNLLKINTYLGSNPNQELSFLLRTVKKINEESIEIALNTNPDYFDLEEFINLNDIPQNIKFVNYFTSNYFEYIKNGSMTLFTTSDFLNNKDILQNTSLIGKPIIVPNENNISSKIREEGYAAHFFSPKNEISLGKGISTIYNSENYTLKLAKKNYATASQNTLESITSAYINLFTNYINKKKYANWKTFHA